LTTISTVSGTGFGIAYVSVFGGSLTSNTAYVKILANSGGVQLLTGATSWSAVSDERLKNIITDNPYPNALDDILTLKPIRYTWKHEDTGIVQIGLIAQSVLPIIPEAISTYAALENEGDNTEYYSLRYSEVIPLLVSSVQQLTTKLQAAMDRISSLENQIASK